MYTLTKKDLLELGFTVTEVTDKNGIKMNGVFHGYNNTNEGFIIHQNNDGSISLGNKYIIYPESFKDIETLIRILTHK